MHNSFIDIDKDGCIIAKSDYEGLVALYLRNNSKFIEKEFYSYKSEYAFKEKPSDGSVSVLFFFQDKDKNIIKFETDLYHYNEGANSLKRIDVKILADSKNYRITHYDLGAKITFVTFNGTKSTKNTLPFGFKFIIENGWNLISVAQDNDTQYQDLSLEVFHDVIQPIVVQKEVYVYGLSLGGYCALYYGGVINATIIAASPKNSAHPSINLARFQKLSFSHRSFSDIPITSNKVYIIYDPTLKSDTSFIHNVIYPAYSTPNLLPIEKGTHIVLQSLIKAQVLSLYIHSIVFNKYDSNIANYITAKCKYSQGKYVEAFMMLDDIVLGSLGTPIAISEKSKKIY